VRPSRKSTLEERDSIRTKSIRALIEIRPGAGASGINISLKEEAAGGDGALYRIENGTPFPVWISQDGVLANPLASPADIMHSLSEDASVDSLGKSMSWSEDFAEVDGDLILPLSNSAIALDVPFRQGKYAGRKAATLRELLRLRIGLAPLSSRDGIETMKVIALSEVGQCIRLNPTKLNLLAARGLTKLLSVVRILCIVTTDGPTRVLKLR
jgi:hypothetical protein